MGRTIALITLLGCAALLAGAEGEPGKWRALHVYWPGGDELKKLIAEVMVPKGLDVLIWEIDSNFEFERHPEIRRSDGAGMTTKATAREIAELCRKNHIRLIPLFECLGHQSWGPRNDGRLPLLLAHPELDESADKGEGSNVELRSWCPNHPDVNKLVFDLMDEIVETLQADAIHIGMDEVLEIGHCPRCQGKSNAELFAKCVNDMHKHLAGEKKLTVLMWGDRLIDGEKMPIYAECSLNGTAGAVDLIPKDIVICDWHYTGTVMTIPFFLEKGFRVLPTSWRDVEAALKLIDSADRSRNERMLGHCFSFWHLATTPAAVAAFPSLNAGLARLDLIERLGQIDGGTNWAPPYWAGGDLSALVSDIEKPPAGKAISTLLPRDSAKNFTLKQTWHWGADFYPTTKDPVALVISCTASAPGSHFIVAYKLPVPKTHGKLRLQMYIDDDYVAPESVGTRRYQIWHGDKTLWDEDISVDRRATSRWTDIDVTDAVENGALDLEFRIEAFHEWTQKTATFLGPIRLVEAP